MGTGAREQHSRRKGCGRQAQAVGKDKRHERAAHLVGAELEENVDKVLVLKVRVELHDKLVRKALVDLNLRLELRAPGRKGVRMRGWSAGWAVGKHVLAHGKATDLLLGAVLLQRRFGDDFPGVCHPVLHVCQLVALGESTLVR